MEGGAPAGRGRGEGHNYFVIKEHHKRCGQVIIVTWVFLHQFVRGRISVEIRITMGIEEEEKRKLGLG